MYDYKSLAKALKAGSGESNIKQALTHFSFHAKNDDKRKGNSRYVFAGQFAFRGLVAETLYRRVSGSGTQLQHILGELFKNDVLERIFVFYSLDKLARHSPDFDADAHKHVFVYGLLGFVFEHSPENFVQAFINQHFIFPNDHLIFLHEKNGDRLAQCNFFAQNLYNKKVRIETQKENEKQVSKIFVNQEIIAEATSKSHRYSYNKALKNALIVLSERAERAEAEDPAYEVRRQRLEAVLLQKTEAEKNRRQAAYQEKIRKQKEEKAKLKEQRRQAAIEKDINRRRAKAAAKERREAAQRAAQAEAAKKTNMSANKRRHLQDKAK